jgi:K+-transporting ATPase ATPase C chain
MDNTTSHNAEVAADSGGSMLGHLWASIAATLILVVICCVLYPLVVFGIAQIVFPAKANGSLVKKDGTPATKDEDAVGSSLIGQAFTQTGYFHPRPSAANNSAGSSYSPTGGYDPTGSGGSNYGPLSDTLINGSTQSPTPPATQPAESLTYDGVRLRTIHYALDNGIAFKLYNIRHDGTGDKTEVPLSKYVDSSGNPNDIALVDAFPHASDTDDRMVLIAGDFAKPIPGDAVTASASGLDPHISPANARLQDARVAKARGISADQVEKIVEANTDGPDLGFMGDPGVNVLMVNIALDKQFPLPAPTTLPAAITTTISAGPVTTTQPAAK